MIKIVTGALENIDEREALRYFRAGPDGDAEAIVRECAALALPELDARACYGIFDVKKTGDDIDMGFVRVKSADFSKYIDGCARVITLACTVGVGIDRLIAKYERLSPLRAAALQAVGASAAEGWCDTVCERLRAEHNTKTSRFSCGFGDLPLHLQKDIFAALDVTKNIGISLSDKFFMTPTKSITAFVGIEK